MALITNKDFSEAKRFELNINQLKILYSFQYLITKEDIGKTKGQRRFAKRQWLQSWSASIHDYLSALDAGYTRQFYTPNEMKQAVNTELTNSPSNRTWYPIAVLESTLFIPYTELLRNKVDDKEYRKLKFIKQTKYIKMIVGERGIIKSEDVDRLEKAYKKAHAQIRESGSRVRAIMGLESTRTKGIPLTTTSLVTARSGTIPVGELETAREGVVIIGGGALLGLASGELGVGSMNLLIASSPDFTLLQAARLEVVVKEIILNKRKNIVVAKHILEDYAEQIKKLSKDIQDLESEGYDRESQKGIKNLNQSLKYMQKAYVNMNTFASYFNIGMENN